MSTTHPQVTTAAASRSRRRGRRRVSPAGAPTLWFAAACVLLAHFGGAILWVFSTVLLGPVRSVVPSRVRASDTTLVQPPERHQHAA